MFSADRFTKTFIPPSSSSSPIGAVSRHDAADVTEDVTEESLIVLGDCKGFICQITAVSQTFELEFDVILLCDSPCSLPSSNSTEWLKAVKISDLNLSFLYPSLLNNLV